MPNPKLLEKATKVWGIGDRIQNKLLIPYIDKKGDGKLYILKRNGRNETWTTLAVVQGFNLGSDAYRNRTTFSYSTTATFIFEDEEYTFGQLIALATHVCTIPQNNVYSIKNGSEVEVEHIDFSYRIFGQKVSDKFELPAIPPNPPVFEMSSPSTGVIANNWEVPTEGSLPIENYILKVEISE